MNVIALSGPTEGGRELLREEPVDVLVRDLGKGAFQLCRDGGFLAFDLAADLLKDRLELRGGSPNAQPDQAEGGPITEDDDEDHAPGDDRDVDVVLFPFVEEDRKLLFSDQPRQAVRRRDIAGRQRGERSRVEGAQVPDRRDLLSVLVHQENEFGARVLEKALESLADLLE